MSETREEQHHIDHREEAVGYLKAAWAHGEASDGTDRAIPIQQTAALTHAVLYVGDQLAQLNSQVKDLTAHDHGGYASLRVFRWDP